MLKTRPKPPPQAQDPSEEAARAIGRQLRDARLALGEDVAEVAQHLRIRPDYVAALEDGELGRLPGRPYVVGFLRSYGGHLGLDGDALVARLKAASAGKASARPELSVREPIAEARRGTAAMVTASLLLAAGVYTGYYVIYHVDRGGGEPAVAEAPGDVARLAAETLRRGDAARVEREAVRALPPAPPALPAAPAPTPREAVLASLSASEHGPAVPPRPDASSAVAGEAEPAPGSPRRQAPAAAGREQVLAALDSDRPGAGAPATAGEPGGRLALVATESAWIQVRSQGRDYVRTRTLAPGERFALPNRGDLALWTGNAGGLEVVVDGQSRGRLGQPGEVVKGVPLVADQLKARPAAR